MTSRIRRGRAVKITSIAAGLLMGAVGAIPAGAGLGAQERPACDLLFSGGKIMDGSGNPWFYGDVAVKDGRVIAVGKLRGKFDAGRTVDVSGKVVAPGFIDIHTHTYDGVTGDNVWSGPNEARYGAPNYITQGVTSSFRTRAVTARPTSRPRWPP